MASVEPGHLMPGARPGDASGTEASARLLLALTALYGQRSNYGAEEQRQFTALALGLIDRAGAAACAKAAARLRDHPDVPAVVIERLGAALAVAGPDVVHGILDADDVEADDARERPAPGDRADAGGAADGAAAGAPQSAERPGPPAAGGCPGGPGAAGEGTGRRPLTAEFGSAFLAAAPAGRRAMLAAVAAARGAAVAPPHDSVQVRIDVSPWRGRTGAFARDFARLIEAPQPLAERILNDPSGEPLVIAARAVGMALAVLQRVLVLASPAPHPVARVWDLSELYHAVDVGTARELLAAWRAAARQDGEAAADGLAKRPADETGRAAGSEAVAPGAPVPVSDLRARLRALSARIDGTAVMSRSGPGNAGRHDPQSR